MKGALGHCQGWRAESNSDVGLCLAGCIPIPLGGRPCLSHRAQEPWLALLRVFCFSSGFYLISPSEFERFSLSTKWLVEPRCLVDLPKAKSHSRPSNGNGTGPKRTSGQVR